MADRGTGQWSTYRKIGQWKFSSTNPQNKERMDDLREELQNQFMSFSCRMTKDKEPNVVVIAAVALGLLLLACSSCDVKKRGDEETEPKKDLLIENGDSEEDRSLTEFLLKLHDRKIDCGIVGSHGHWTIRVQKQDLEEAQKILARLPDGERNGLSVVEHPAIEN
jgi:hypothetical protein